LSDTIRVHIADEPEAMSELTSLLKPGVIVTTGREPPPGADYDILVAGVPERSLIEASPRLTALVIPWSGVPNRTRELMVEFPDVSVHNLHHNAGQVAEMAMALLFSAAKRIVPMDRELRRGNWSERYEHTPVLMLEGRTAVVLGYGAIGQRVARLCRGIAMKTIAVRRGPVPAAEAQGQDSVRAVSELGELLPLADALIVCLPLTSETRGMIGEGELETMPSGAILVNVGRGPVVDQTALYLALRTGTIGAAGLDVWYNYPTDEASRLDTRPADHPFGELDNVVMSPHRAGAPNTEETESFRVRELAGLLNSAARGEELPNRVDLAIGY
jgi:phosphoglycerate dehydrogenase-like enzyme